MPRIVIIGNAGAGKSTLARQLAAKRGLQHVEIDKLLWQPGWVRTPDEEYERKHNEAVSGDGWIIDGLGRKASFAKRLARATEVILVDMPLWMHFWLAAERQLAWTRGELEHTPGGIAAMPSTRALFKAIWEVDRTWMPEIRALCMDAERQGKPVMRLQSVEDLTRAAGALV